MLVLCIMQLGSNIKIIEEDIKNAKELYDYYLNVDKVKAALYKNLLDQQPLNENHVTRYARTVREVKINKHIEAKTRVNLRQRMPKFGNSKTIAEIIEEILTEKDKPLTAKELMLLMREKGRVVAELKDFSSQLIALSKLKGRFFREKVNNTNYWGLSEWQNGTSFKYAYLEKMYK